MEKENIDKLYRERVIDNRQLKMVDVIKYLLQQEEVRSLDVAVGYFYLSGLLLIKDEFIKFMDEKNGQLRILMGNETNGQTANVLNGSKYKDYASYISNETKKDTDTITDGEFLSRLAGWIDEKRIKVQVYTGDANYFHAKSYLFAYSQDETHGTAIVGSSNFSRNGLEGNTELNVLSQDNYYALHRWYSDLWLSDETQAFSPDLLKIVKSNISPRDALKRDYKPVKQTYYEFANLYAKPYAKLDEHKDWVKELFPHQRSGVISIKDKLDSYGTAVLADGVGLGKTRIAGGVMRLYKDDSAPYKTLIVADKKLKTQWAEELDICGIESGDYDWMSREEFVNTPWNQIKVMKYSLVIIDEAHIGFKNNNTQAYQKMRWLKDQHPELRGLMITATPWNNRREDVINIGTLFLNIDDIPNDRNYKQYLLLGGRTNKAIRKIANDNTAFNQLWEDIFLQRTRKTYGGKQAQFATRTFPTVDIQFEPRKNQIFSDNFAAIAGLKFPYMDPIKYLDPTKEPLGANQLKLLLLKRADSSWVAYRNTLQNIIEKLTNLKKQLDFVTAMPGKKLTDRFKGMLSEAYDLSDYLAKNQLSLLFNVSEEENQVDEHELRSRNKKRIYLDKITKQIDDITNAKAKKAVNSMLADCNEDLEVLNLVLNKLNQAYQHIDEKMEKIISTVAKEQKLGHKVIIISQFADTVNYYYENLYRYFNTPKITLPMGKVLGNDKENYINRIPAKNKEEVLDAFSPVSKRQQQIIDDDRQIDLVVGTDTISTGQNLQDAVTLINLDLPYNPMILEQRIGRIDRPRHDAARVRLYIYTCPVYQSIDSQLKMTKRLGSKMQGVLEDTQFDNVVLPEYTNYLKATAEHKQNTVANMLDQTEDAITYQNGMQSEKHSEQYRFANKRMYDFKTNGNFKQDNYILPNYSFARNDLDSIAVIQLHLKDVNDSALRNENIIVNLTKQKEETVVAAEQAIHESIKDDIISTKKLSQGKAELKTLNAKEAIETVIHQVIDQYNADQAVTATNEKSLSSKKGRVAATKIRESVQNPKNRTMILSKLKSIDMKPQAVAPFAKYLETVGQDDPAYPLVEIIADNVDYFWTHISEYREYLTPDSIAAAQHIGKERRHINTRKASLDNSDYDLLLSNLIVND